MTTFTQRVAVGSVSGCRRRELSIASAGGSRGSSRKHSRRIDLRWPALLYNPEARRCPDVVRLAIFDRTAGSIRHRARPETAALNQAEAVILLDLPPREAGRESTRVHSKPVGPSSPRSWLPTPDWLPEPYAWRVGEQQEGGHVHDRIAPRVHRRAGTGPRPSPAGQARPAPRHPRRCRSGNPPTAAQWCRCGIPAARFGPNSMTALGLDPL